MDAIKCKTCDAGTLVLRKKYRMSGIVVVIGYIVLVPSIIGILIGLVGVVSVGSSSGHVLDTQRSAAEVQLRGANIPTPVIAKVAKLQSLTVADTVHLDIRQRAAVRDAHLSLTASTVGAGAGAAIAGGVFLVLGVVSLVGGLLGWLLVMKKRVLQCDHCGAVIAAS